MIKAEVSPNITDKRIDVRHIKKHARTKSMAAVMMGNVTLGKKAIGTLTGEYEDAITWEALELPESIKTRFRTARYDGKFIDAKTGLAVRKAQAVVCLGESFYYLP